MRYRPPPPGHARGSLGAVNTSPEDTQPTDESTAPEDAPTAREEEGGTSGAGDAFLAGTPTSSPSGLFSAETFSLVGVMMLAVTALNTRLLQLFGLFTVGPDARFGAAENAAAASVEIVVAGGLSALSVLAAALSLFLGGYTTRAWSRWTAAATVIVGTLLVLVSVLTYVSLPATG